MHSKQLYMIINRHNLIIFLFIYINYLLMFIKKMYLNIFDRYHLLIWSILTFLSYDFVLMQIMHKISSQPWNSDVHAHLPYTHTCLTRTLASHAHLPHTYTCLTRTNSFSSRIGVGRKYSKRAPTDDPLYTNLSRDFKWNPSPPTGQPERLRL